MPIVRIEMLSGRSPQTKQRLAKEITDSMARICMVEPAHIYVMFQDISPQDWAVAGETFAAPKGAADKPGTQEPQP